MVQKIGGYQKNGSNTFTGKARSAMDWQTLALEKFIAIGTHLKLHLWKGGTYYDITPIRKTVNPMANNPFAMTNLSTTVTVTDVAHGALTGDYVTFSGASAGGGITISGEYQLTKTTDDAFTIVHSAAATSTTSGGGAAVVAAYQINIGVSYSVAGMGWGASTWGASTWGTARSVSNFLAVARTWGLDNWGEDLIANPRDGGIYVWDASVGTSTRAAALGGTAPTTAKSVFVSDQNRHLVVLAPDGENLKVSWSSSEDYTDFTADASNTAGSKLLDGGNELFMGVKTKLGTLLFTDSVLWLMKFDGPPFTFIFERIGSANGIRGPNAAKEFDGRVFWMGQNGFWYYDGSIKMLDCDVLPTIFDDIDNTQSALVYAGANRPFNEIWWLYPTDGETECDRYVLYNTELKTWAFGTLARTVLIGDSDTFGNPYAMGADGYLYDHDFGVNADGAALSAYAETSDMEIASGEDIMFVDQMIPDFSELDGTLSVTLKGRRYPKDEQLTKGPYSVTSSSELVNVRITARQLSVRLEVSDVGAHFRTGTLRINIQPDGQR